MPTEHIIALLIEERDRLSRAIEVLQSPGASREGAKTKVAGASPKAANGAGGTQRRGMSAAARKAASERMRKYWAAKRKARSAKKA